MTYQEARAYLEQIRSKGDRLGLESVRHLADALGNPQDRLRFIHIAGTNGKGSVMAYLENTLIRAGYRIGRYTSPAVFTYEERFRVNGCDISHEALADLVSGIRPVLETLAGDDAWPTIFEVETLMAFSWFAAEECELVLLETGMGGETDATNIVGTSVLEIFSSISMDHMAFLGDTIGEIAQVKAGIIKPGTLAVSDAQHRDVAGVLAREARRKHADIRFAEPEAVRDVRCSLKEQSFTYKGHEQIMIRQAGTYQIRNAVTALEAVDALRELGWQVPEEAVRAGFAETYWPGRFEVISERPLIVIDGAHNADAARQLYESVRRYFSDKKLTLIMGVFSDKEYDKMLQILLPLAQRFWAVQAHDNKRALPAWYLRDLAAKSMPDAVCMGSVQKAVRTVLAEAESGRDAGRVYLFCGSLAWLREVRAGMA